MGRDYKELFKAKPDFENFSMVANMLKFVSGLALLVVAVAALPHKSVSATDGDVTSRFSPSTQIQYHLFTRKNPTQSQPLLSGNLLLLENSNFDPTKRVVFLVHGYMDNVIAPFNTVVVPAFLEADNCNVIVVDWSAGSSDLIYLSSVGNVGPAAVTIATFIMFLNIASGAKLWQYHLVGHGLGGHVVGGVGRNLGGQIPYITALDPSGVGFLINSDKFNKNDGKYTEVIHTNAGVYAYMGDLGHKDFYPNGGVSMPGCFSQDCNHQRAFHYFAESLVTGGFRGTGCLNYGLAVTGWCSLADTADMGGLSAKPGSEGVYHLSTYSAPPFSMA